LQAIINYLGKRIELVEIKKNNRFYIDKYLFLPPVSDDGNGFLPNKIINIMRNSIFRFYEINFRQEGYRKIYLSRSKSSKRRILNEDEFYLILKNKGFELIHAEDLSFKEQVKLFSESAFIIGVHGAGLTNILFCPNNCKLIELHPSNVVRSHYMLLAKSLNLYYQYEVGTNSNENDDFYIMVDNFNTEYL
jgi:capsular polysaccharide biosynthesis protein